jgi:superfamily I DNA and/or RNA helicase
MINKSITNCINEMSEALDDEIKALKEGEGGKRINLIEGEFNYNTADKYIYKFIIDTELVNIEDSPGQLIIPGNYGEERKVQVTVNNIEANEINIASNEDLGNYVPEAILVIAPYYLLEILKERLQEINQKKLDVNDKLLLYLLEAETPNIIEKVNAFNYSGLNKQQARALISSLQNDITFVWGPPGTGKTFTIGHIISHFIEQDKTVLIASHTNSAIDTALIKVAEVIKDKSILYEGKIIRVGLPHTQGPELEPMLLENIINKRSQELMIEKNRLEDKLKSLENTIGNLSETIKLFDVLEGKKADYSGIKEDIKKDEEILKNKSLLLKNYETQLKKEQDNLTRVENANFIIRFLNRPVEEIKKEIQNFQQKIDDENQALVEIKERIERNRNREKEIKATITKLENTLQLATGHRSKPELVNEVDKLQKNCAEIKREISNINKQIEEIRSNIIKESLVVGTTLAKTTLETDIYEMDFDVVIVDEASMAPVPNVFFTSGLAREHLIISGDFRQLAPIAVTRSEMAEKWLKKDIYFHTGIENNIDKDGKDDRVVMLNEQYRLKNIITDVINDFYFGKLISKKDREPIKLPAPFDKDILFCDTSTINPWCSRPRNSYSRYNIYTAILAVNIAEDALEKGINEIGIIVPYSAQAQLIHKIILDKGLHREIKAATVHKYQGDEKELIIIDTVDGLPYKVGKLMRGGLGSDAMRLINVAVTRTSNKLVIINNYDHFNKLLYSEDSVLKVISKIYKSAHFIMPEFYLSSYASVNTSILNSKKSIPFNGDIISRNEANFYQAFKEDLNKAREKVIIISPFITRYRLSNLIDHFRHLVDKGIEVIIFMGCHGDVSFINFWEQSVPKIQH